MKIKPKKKSLTNAFRSTSFFPPFCAPSFFVIFFTYGLCMCSINHFRHQIVNFIHQKGFLTHYWNGLIYGIGL